MGNNQTKTLDQIMLSYQTDKHSRFHDYCHTYDKLFTPYRDKGIIFLEIGLGNRDDPNQGESILGWRDYFENARIVGIDVDDKSYFDQEERLFTYQGSSDDANFLAGVSHLEGGFDIVVDDGCHHVRHTLVAFETLFPLMKSGGIYCIEDTVAPSYWPGWEGQETIFDSKFMEYFFRLCHFVNLKKQNNFQVPSDIPIPSWIKEIESIHFYHSQIVINKI